MSSAVKEKEEGLLSAKLILLGESYVGKTSIITRYVDGKFTKTEATVGAQFFNKKITLPNNGGKYLLNIWDTAGAEKYRSVNKFFYRNSSIVILVYDVTDQKSYEELVNYWYQEVLKEVGKNVVIAILGNKSDLFEQEAVDEQTARSFAQSVDAVFGLCSALDGSGIQQVFTDSVLKLDGILKAHHERKHNNSVNSSHSSSSGKRKKKQHKLDVEDDNDDGFALDNKEGNPGKSKCC